MLQNPLKLGTDKLHHAIVNAMMDLFGWKNAASEEKVKCLENKYFSVLEQNLVVVVEYPYVDKVYRNSFYRYYAGKARHTSRDCIRLSFMIDTNPSLEDQPMNPDIWEKQYKGFLVLRPTEINIVGRNAICPSIFIEHNFVICKTDIPASINGLKVKVEAFPASSQDSETMVCAETAVWALMEYFGNRYAEYSPIRPSHIIKLLRNWRATRQLPSEGLTSDQICYLIKNMNFQPVKHPISDTFGLEEIGSFVESGIPVVLVINNLDNDKCNKHLAHAIICIGHEDILTGEIDNALEEDKENLKIVDFDKIKKKFVFIDDNFPPYRMDYLESPTDSYSSNDWKACKIKLSIFPLYEKILLMPSMVKSIAKNLLLVLNINMGHEITMRTFLASSRSYRDYVCRGNMLAKMKETILNLYLPKFIWVVELSTRDGLKHNYAEGIMIFDATEPKLTNLESLDFMCYNKMIIFRDDKQELKKAQWSSVWTFDCYRRNLR